MGWERRKGYSCSWILSNLSLILFFKGETVLAKLKANNTSVKPTRRINIKVISSLLLPSPLPVLISLPLPYPRPVHLTQKICLGEAYLNYECTRAHASGAAHRSPSPVSWIRTMFLGYQVRVVFFFCLCLFLFCFCFCLI